jgi:putative membrane protein
MGRGGGGRENPPEQHAASTGQPAAASARAPDPAAEEMSMNRGILIAMTGACALAGGCKDNATHSTGSTVSGNSTVGMKANQGSDSAFMMDVAKGNAAELRMADLALQKSQNQDIKRYAQMLRDDHTKAGEELKAIARTESVQLPGEPDQAHQQAADRLSRLSGESFDREWIKAMVEDHQKTIAKFEDEARSGKDAQVKSWAAKTLPTLREHLQHARDIQSRLSSKGMGDTGQ